MKNLKSNILLSTLVSAAALFATASNAAESNKLQEAYKSSNVKSALINVCKEETAKSKKLSAAEVSKYCTCAVEADGKLTNAQKMGNPKCDQPKEKPVYFSFCTKAK